MEAFYCLLLSKIYRQLKTILKVSIYFYKPIPLPLYSRCREKCKPRDQGCKGK